MARAGFVFMAFFLEPQISDLFTATENPILIEINHPVLAVWLKQFFTAGCLLISELLINKLFIYLFIYFLQKQGRLPVKWTAHEALLYGTYTTQSDV